MKSLVRLTSFDRRFGTDMSRPVHGIQMGIFFHLQNHCREILFSLFVRLPRIDLKCSSRSGHSRSNGSRETENQTKVLVHQPNLELGAVVVLLCSLQFARVRWSHHCSLGQLIKQTISIKASLFTESDGFGNRLHSDSQ